MTVGGYRVLIDRSRHEETIEKSRFVTTLAPAATADDARAFVDEIRGEFRDASHNCWAYRIGAPENRAQIGLSDDGEPHGTAGRPMLDVVLGSTIGDLVVVVTRWFGGTKLGKGGLVRAYGDCVKHALEKAATQDKIDWVEFDLEFDYDRLRSVVHQHPRIGAQVLEETFAASVRQRVRVPRANVELACMLWRDATAGRIAIHEQQGR